MFILLRKKHTNLINFWKEYRESQCFVFIPTYHIILNEISCANPLLSQHADLHKVILLILIVVWGFIFFQYGFNWLNSHIPVKFLLTLCGFPINVSQLYILCCLIWRIFLNSIFLSLLPFGDLRLCQLCLLKKKLLWLLNNLLLLLFLLLLLLCYKLYMNFQLSHAFPLIPQFKSVVEA